MKTIKLIIILLSVTISSSLVSCGTDEPSLPNKDNEWNNSDWNNSNNDNNGEDNPSSNIEGSEILGTWYYLSPDEAIKIEIRFTSETYLLGHKCFVSVDSKFPSYTSDNMKSWEYKDNKWKIVSLDIGGPFLPSLIIENVFDDEMWADLVRGSSQRLKFKRKDMGQPSTPTGKVLAPDGFFGNYVWNGYVSGYNISFKFVKTNSTYYIEEVSDRSVYVDGYNKSVTTSRPEGVYSDGYLKLDPAKSMIAGLSGSGYFVAVKKSSTEVELYNPFTPNKVYTFKR